MNTTWIIEWMRAKPAEGNLTNVVIEAGWRCNGTQVSNSNTYSGTVYGAAAMGQPGSPFIQYDNLTEAKVLEWVWAAGVDKGSAEAAVQAQIDNQIAPPVVQPPLPWA